MDVDMRVFLAESLECSYSLNESSNKSDNRKFSDKLNDIIASIIKKLKDLFERFKAKFKAIINKILSKLGLNTAKDLKTFKEGFLELKRNAAKYNLPAVEIHEYNDFVEKKDFPIINGVVDMYENAVNRIKKYAEMCPSLYKKDIIDNLLNSENLLRDAKGFSFSWGNVDNWGEMMTKAMSPVAIRSVDIGYALYSIFTPDDSIYCIDNLEEVLSLGSSGYSTKINTKVASIMTNINNILDNAKDELKLLLRKDEELENSVIVFDKFSKLTSTIPSVVAAVTNGIMGAASEVCRRAVILANMINKINRANGYGDVIDINKESNDSSASFSKLMR